MDEIFEYLISKYGRPSRATAMLPEALEALEGKLPGNLLEFWRECGLGFWHGSKFQFCNPLEYRSVVQLALKGDPQFRPETTHMYGFTAFGQIWLFCESGACLEIDLARLWAASPVTNPDWRPLRPEQEIFSGLCGLDDACIGNFFEESPGGPLLLQRAENMLGELAFGEVYGFVPALEIGGTATLACLKRNRALEHLRLLAQLGSATLFDYSNGAQKPVRVLGSI